MNWQSQEDMFSPSKPRPGKKASPAAVVTRDHGLPTHRAHIITNEDKPNERRWSGWVYCPLCLAEKDGHHSDGRPRFSGGLMRVQYRDYQNHLRVISARCTCKHGDKWRRAYLPYTAFNLGDELVREIHSAAGEVVKVFVPGKGEGVRVEAIGGGPA